jgi:hypothetical protein
MPAAPTGAGRQDRVACAWPAWWFWRGVKNPIPFRTRPLNPSAPMVLSLKAWESRSPPGPPSACRPRDQTVFSLPPVGWPGCDAGWSSPVARQAHNLKVTGSNPVPATRHANGPLMAGRWHVWAGDGDLARDPQGGEDDAAGQKTQILSP